MLVARLQTEQSALSNAGGLFAYLDNVVSLP